MPSSKSTSLRAPRAMRSTMAIAGALSSAFVLLACVADETYHYGPPGGLLGKVPVSVSGEGGVTNPAPTGTGTGTSGTDSGPPTSGVCGGKGPVDGGACTVSWKNDIYAQMQPAGHWKCADAKCHQPGASPPAIDPADSHKAYATLVAYGLSSNGNKPYLNECSTDPAAASIGCNLSATPCGLGMPLTSSPPGGVALTADEQTKLQKWLQCGSPEN